MARWKNANRAAAAASSRSQSPANNPSTDNPLQQLRILNARLVTEVVDLRKQIKLLNAKLASKDSPQCSTPVSSDLSHSTAAEGYAAISPPVELNLDAKESVAAETEVSPVDTDTVPTSVMESAAGAAAAAAELLEEVKNIVSEYSEISDQVADAEEMLAPAKAAPPSKQLCSDLSVVVSSSPRGNDGVDGDNEAVIPLHPDENLIAAGLATEHAVCMKGGFTKNPLTEANLVPVKTKTKCGNFSKLVYPAGILAAFSAGILVGCSAFKK